MVLVHNCSTCTGTNTYVQGSDITSPALTTTGKSLLIQCNAIGALTFYTPGIMGGTYGAVVGISQTNPSSTNADQGCEEIVLTQPLTSFLSTLNSNNTTGALNTLAAFYF